MSDGNSQDGEFKFDFGESQECQQRSTQYAASTTPDALLKIGEHTKDDAFLATTREVHDLLCRRQPP
ncbi:hypothetical protein OC835_006241 [Tilletia horrida]|nr:hypothetical protein OC835_006241 [Tilletia horrida]